MDSRIGILGYVVQEPERIDGLVQILGRTLDVGLIDVLGSTRTFDASLGLREGAGVDYTLGLLADRDRDVHIWSAFLYDDDRLTGLPDSSMAHHSSVTAAYRGGILARFWSGVPNQTAHPSHRPLCSSRSARLCLAPACGTADRVVDRRLGDIEFAPTYPRDLMVDGRVSLSGGPQVDAHHNAHLSPSGPTPSLTGSRSKAARSIRTLGASRSSTACSAGADRVD